MGSPDGQHPRLAGDGDLKEERGLWTDAWYWDQDPALRPESPTGGLPPALSQARKRERPWSF